MKRTVTTLDAVSVASYRHHPGAKPHQVHLLMSSPERTVILRLSSARAVDELLHALATMRMEVFGATRDPLRPADAGAGGEVEGGD